MLGNGADGGEPLLHQSTIEIAWLFRSLIRTFVDVFVAAGKRQTGP